MSKNAVTNVVKSWRSWSAAAGTGINGVSPRPRSRRSTRQEGLGIYDGSNGARGDADHRATDHRQRLAHPFPGRSSCARRAENPTKDREDGERPRHAEELRVDGWSRLARRHGVQFQPGRETIGGHHSRRARAEDDRQRPAAAAAMPTFGYGPPQRRHGIVHNLMEMPHDVALVFVISMGRHAGTSRPASAGGGRHADGHSREFKKPEITWLRSATYRGRHIKRRAMGGPMAWR